MINVKTLGGINCCTFIIDEDVPIHLALILRENYYQIT